MAVKQSYIGIRERGVTMDAGATLQATYDKTKSNGTIHAQKAVMISGAGEVELVSTGSQIFGRLRNLEDDGFCSVADEGYLTLPTDGTVITYGSGLIGGATAGTVKTGTSSRLIAIASGGTNLVVAKLY